MATGQDMLSQKRKVALITGGAKRVGRTVGLYFAARGYDLIVTYHRSQAEADSLVAEAGGLGASCQLIQADLRHLEAVDRVVASVKTGRLDLLMHNASVFPKAGLEETTPELLAELFTLHVHTPLLLTRRLVPQLKAAKGHVLAMTDLAASKPFKGYLAYSASKAALQNLMLGLAKTLAPEARANCIAPGAVEFPDNMPEEERAAYLKKVPLGRVGTAEEVARAAWFLTEEATYQTGTILTLDGGRSLS